MYISFLQYYEPSIAFQYYWSAQPNIRLIFYCIVCKLHCSFFMRPSPPTAGYATRPVPHMARTAPHPEFKIAKIAKFILNALSFRILI